MAKNATIPSPLPCQFCGLSFAVRRDQLARGIGKFCSKRCAASKTLADKLDAMTVIDPGTGCFIWMGHRDRKGYGKAYHQGQARLVHRLAYETSVGPIPEGLALDHLCSSPPCLNVDHLEPVTTAENNRRSALRHRSARVVA